MVNAAFVVRIVRDGDSMILHLTTGETARTTVMLEVVKSGLKVIEPIDFDDEEDLPF